MIERGVNLIDVSRQCGNRDLLRQSAKTTLTKLMTSKWHSESVQNGERSDARTTHRSGYRERALGSRVSDFLERSLEGGWPYLWLDVTYLKVRQGGSG